MRVQVYEWLRGDGNCFIDTKIKEDALSIKSSVKIYIYDVRQCIVSSYSDAYTNDLSVEVSGMWTLPKNGFRVWSGNKSDVTTNSLIIGEVYDFQIIAKDKTINVEVLNNGSVFAKHSQEYTTPIHKTLRLFADYRFGINNQFVNQDLAIGATTINEHIFKPCKLLSPYQSHNAGECAMIDVLSNTLYFNQGSGAFSVEGEAGEIIDTTPVINNIISPMSTKAVRLREWLRGDGNSFIIVNGCKVNQIFNMKFTSINSFQYLSAVAIGRVGNAVAQGNSELGLGSWFIRCYNGRELTKGLSGVKTQAFDISPNGGCVMNGVKYGGTYPNEPINPYETDLVLFNFDGTVTSTRKMVGSISDVYIGDINNNPIAHLHPCDILLHPTLPPQSCMIDLKTGNLYTNNQGTGQFSCEGAFLGYWQDKPMTDHYCDVEGALHKSVQIFADNGERLALMWEKSKPWTSHRWLRIYDETTNRIRTFMQTSFDDSDIDIRVRRNNGTNMYIAQIENLASVIIFSQNISLYTKKTFNADINGILDVSINNSRLAINGEEYALNGQQRQVWLRGYNNAYDLYFNYINIGDLHLTPAVLNRPTLASEDNNGIARKKGEAVFVDEQRYRRGLPWCFGNVASSGSFSVSDYLIEGEDYEVSGTAQGDNIPCTLLRTIEPYCATDNTEHYKGEQGTFNKVSGMFTPLS